MSGIVAKLNNPVVIAVMVALFLYGIVRRVL